MVGQRVQHRTGRPRVALFWWDILGPVSMISWSSFGDNFIRIELGTDKIEPEEYVVPKEDDEVRDSPTDLVEKSHDCSGSINNFQLEFWTVRACVEEVE
jgi:hypothetical protein